ncbi:MAG: metal-dependent transcriptional regulator [Clostridiales bacterium]|nr:metal-dependent transcriptional regulator [Clostridiales bacterium]
MSAMSMSNEDYIEAIYVLSQSGQSVRSTEVADKLKVSRPAVNKAMNELIEKSLVTKENYGRINLTEAGDALAEQIYSRHRLLNSFLLKIGVSAETAETDCCKIEHCVSEETVRRLRSFMAKL